MKEPNFSHLDSDQSPKMVDVGEKPTTERVAVAETTVKLPEDIARNLDETGMQSSKGAIFDIASLAGTQAAKKTWDLIPLCHMIALDSVTVDLERVGADRIVIRCKAKATHKTGVEMEALVGSSVAALTIYDMCKSLSKDIVIGPTRLISKSGGKSDYQSEGGSNHG